MTLPAPISLRLPEALKDSIQKSAMEAGRSINAEIRMRLEWSLSSGFDGRASETMLANEVESLRSELRGHITSINDRLKKLDELLETKMDKP